MLKLKWIIVIILGIGFFTSWANAQSANEEIRDELLNRFLFKDLSTLDSEIRLSYQQDRDNFGWNNVKPEEVIEIKDPTIQVRFLEHHFTKVKKEEFFEVRKGVKLSKYIFFYYKVRNYYVVVQVYNRFEGEVDDDGNPIFAFGKSGFAIFDLQFNHKVTYAL